MKKYLSLFVVIAIMFVANVQITRASNEQGQGEITMERKTVQNQVRENFDKLRINIKNEKDAVMARNQEMRIVGREKALERFDTAVERINNLKDKINTRIANLEAKGVVVEGAKNFIATVETKLNVIDTKIIEINTILSASINELTLENKTQLRTLAQDTQTLIKEAHQALNDAIKSLKDNLKVKLEK